MPKSPEKLELASKREGVEKEREKIHEKAERIKEKFIELVKQGLQETLYGFNNELNGKSDEEILKQFDASGLNKDDLVAWKGEARERYKEIEDEIYRIARNIQREVGGRLEDPFFKRENGEERIDAEGFMYVFGGEEKIDEARKEAEKAFKEKGE